MSEEYRWSDEDVALHLGVTKRDLKTLRKEQLVPIVHYEIVAGKNRYSDKGLFALCAFAKVDPPDGLDSSKKTAPAETVEEKAVELTVERLCPNPTWIMCRVDGVMERCRVRNNAYLRFKQKIRAVKTGDHFTMLRIKA